MDFDYSEEQRQLQQQARRFLKDRCPPSAVRAVLANPELSFDRGLWGRTDSRSGDCHPWLHVVGLGSACAVHILEKA
jgi:hypothetical protein